MNQKSNLKEDSNRLKANMATDFFQVSINSHKLSEMFNKLNATVTRQDLKIAEVTKHLRQTARGLQQKIAGQEKKRGIMETRMEGKLNQNQKNINACITKVVQNMQAKNRSFQAELQVLNSKIGKVEDFAKEDLERGLQNLKLSIFGEPAVKEQTKQQNSKNIKKFTNFTAISNHMTESLQEHKEKTKEMIQYYYYQRQGERKLMQNQNFLQDKLKKKVNEEDVNIYISHYQEQPLNQIRYANNKKKPGKTQMMNNFARNSPKLQQGISLGGQNLSDQEDEQLLGNLNNKIANLEKDNKRYQTELKEIRNKNIVLEEKQEMMGRKSEKMSHDLYDLRNMFKKVDDKKLDEKLIDDLKSNIKWVVRDLQEKLEKKCSQEALNREKSKLMEKISIIHENMIEKADKREMSKAIIFLEEKMKEIIFLIAAESTDSKDGAIMKTNVKCLSCDKQVEKGKKTSEAKNRHSNDVPHYNKPMSHRVRNVYREQLKQTYTVGDEAIE